MSIVPAPTDTDVWHPSWCDRKHLRGAMVHERKIGVDLELAAGLAFGVGLQQVDLDEDAPTEVLLQEKAPGATSLTRLSVLEASMLRTLLGEALGLVGR